MSDELDFKPEEPKPELPADGAGAGASGAGAGAGGLPAGFVVPKVIVEGPDEDPEEAAEQARKEDIEKHKGVAILAYISPLFVITLVVAPHSKYARHHANQGLLIFILGVAAVLISVFLNLMLGLLPILEKFTGGVVGWFASCGLHLAPVFLIVGVLALAVMGIIHAANGESKPLPLIGRYTLIR